MPHYYARIGEECFKDGSVLMVREDGTRDFVSVRTREVLLEDHETAVHWTKECYYQLHEVFPLDPSLLVDEGL